MTETKRWIGDIRRVPPPELWDEVAQRSPRPDGHPTRPRLAVALLVVTLAIVGSVLYALGGLGSGSSSAVPGPGEIVRYRLPGPPQPLAVGSGAAWVAVSDLDGGTGSTIWRIDATTGESEALPWTTGAEWVTTGDGGVWVTCVPARCGGPAVLQLDPVTGDLIRTIPLPSGAFQVAAGLGSVWVTSRDGLTKIDAVSGSVTATFHAAHDAVRGIYVRVGTGGGSVWVTTQHGLVQLDPMSGVRESEFPFDDACWFDATPAVVFVASCGGAGRRVDELAALDAATGRVLYRVPLHSSFGAGQMRLDGQTLWIAENDPANADFIRLLPIDAATGERAGPPFEIDLGPARFGTHSAFSSFAFFDVGEGSAWLSDFGAGEVIRVGLPITGTGMPTPEPSQNSGSSPTRSPEHPVAAVRVILDHEIDVPTYDRVITPGRGEPFVGEEAAVDEAWRAVGEGTHPAAVVDVYVEWNGQPMWIVSFQGGDVCPFISGPVTRSPSADVCGGNTWNVRIDARDGRWLDTYANGKPMTLEEASQAPLPSIEEVLRS